VWVGFLGAIPAKQPGNTIQKTIQSLNNIMETIQFNQRAFGQINLQVLKLLASRAGLLTVASCCTILGYSCLLAVASDVLAAASKVMILPRICKINPFSKILYFSWFLTLNKTISTLIMI
jgi:hypothetical protein